MQRLASWTWTVFVLFAVLAFLFGVFPGTWFEEGAADREEQWLVTSFAFLAVVFTVGIALTAYRRGERWAWLVFWAWPVFFVIHGVFLWAFDFVFAALGAAALLVSAAARRRTPA